MTLFDPSREQVRRFFCETWRKEISGGLLTSQEAQAADLIRLHPEYHTLLGDVERALAEDYTVERGQTNPFLHLSMHLALAEQLSIDQPRGIVDAMERLAVKLGNAHAAAHEAIECLGRVVWEAQRGTLPADAEAINAEYLDCLRKRASKA